MSTNADNILNDPALIKDLDKSDMYRYLHSQAEDTLRSYEEAKKKYLDIKDIDNIIAAGMGGSVMAPTAIKYLFEDELKVPFIISQTYDLPRFASSNTLFLAISDSGETEEVISQYYQMKKKGGNTIAIAQGSRLISMATSDDIPYFQYHTSVPSRASFAFMFGSSVAFLENSGLIGDNVKRGLSESINILNGLTEKIGPHVPADKNPAKKFAISLQDSIPLAYAEPPFYSIGSRFTKMMNENAGRYAFYNIFPEARHNEISAWNSPHTAGLKITPIFLRDAKGKSPMEREINEIEDVIKNSQDIIELSATGETKIARFFSLQFMMDMISYYSGILALKDPSITPALKELKNKLRNENVLPV